MQAQYRSPPHSRVGPHNGAKRQLLGNPAAMVPPAWKVNAQSKEKQKQEEGSKIMLSRLPVDVGDSEVEELFKKTVGPVKEAFIIYNSQGRSKGMAIVAFQRPGDAAVARTKYDGKFVDQKRPIKIELFADSVPETRPPAPPTAPSLLSRLGGISASGGPSNQHHATTPKVAVPPLQPRRAFGSHSIHALPPISRQRLRMKKGPRRVKKSATQLDAEMEEYRAASNVFSFTTDSS